MNEMIEHEADLDILEHIHHSSESVSQRDLAFVVGKSLGMTNAILKRLTEKGLLTIAKVNNRNISYAVTPHGLRALAGRSYRYFKRTIRNVVYYRDGLEALVKRYLRDTGQRQSSKDERGLLLVGKSDLDFIIEHMGLKYRLPFSRVSVSDTSTDSELYSGYLVFISEDRVLDEVKDSFILNRLPERRIALRQFIEASELVSGDSSG